MKNGSRAPSLTLLFAASAVLALTGVFSLNAQATDGNLVGVVVDQMGASIPGATVEITNTATSVKAATTTRMDGAYRFNNLLAGSYDLRASRTGFTTTSLRG